MKKPGEFSAAGRPPAELLSVVDQLVAICLELKVSPDEASDLLRAHAAKQRVQDQIYARHLIDSGTNQQHFNLNLMPHDSFCTLSVAKRSGFSSPLREAREDITIFRDSHGAFIQRESVHQVKDPDSPAANPVYENPTISDNNCAVFVAGAELDRTFSLKTPYRTTPFLRRTGNLVIGNSSLEWDQPISDEHLWGGTESRIAALVFDFQGSPYTIYGEPYNLHALV